MPPFRMPFGRKQQNVGGMVTDENQVPFQSSATGPYGSKPRPSAISIKSQKSDEPQEFKLGLVDGNGSYLPPSPPPEKSSFWKRTPTSTTTSSHRSVLSDNDGFSISRESFDSYRRSFDISAKSPVIHAESTFSRQSLDSLRTPYTPRSTRQNSGKSFESPRTTEVNTVDEEDVDVFEDVGLDDGSKPQKKGIFGRFMKDESNASQANGGSRPGSAHRTFHLPGRKRGQSGQGAELGAMPRPLSSKGQAEELKDTKPQEITA